MTATRTRATRREALIGARHAAGLTQEELAERVGIDRRTVARIEAGTMTPNVTVALALSRALRKSVEKLFGGER